MAQLIQKYISQIRKKLCKRNIPLPFIEEFIDNLEEQLLSMLEELLLQEPSLSSDDAQISVLSSCEPVNTVVERVVHEYQSKDIIPSLESKELPSELRFLDPLESFLQSASRQLDRFLSRIVFFTQLFKTWYLQNGNPVLTSFLYFALIVGSISLMQILFLILPTFYQVTVFPSNDTYYLLGGQDYSIPSYITQDVTITGLSVTPISIYVQAILIIIVFILSIMYLGWSRPIRQSVLTGFLVTLIITISTAFLSLNYRLDDITQNSIEHGWTSFTPDWYYTYIPSLAEYTNFFFQSVVIHGFLLISTTIFSLVLLGSFLNTLKTKNFPKPLTVSITKSLLMLFLILICIGSSLVIPQTSPELRGEDIDYLLPGMEFPVFYSFSVRPEGVTSLQHEQNHNISFPEFGDMSFIWNGIFQLQINISALSPLNLQSRGELTVLWDEEAIPSQALFDVFGLFYLPNQDAGRTWTDLVENDLNSSTPLKGFSPYANTTSDILNWLVNRKYRSISVNTVTYHSQTNQSVYNFSFDPTTGFLLKATLVRKDSNWVSGYDTKILEIKRTFGTNVIDNVNEFASLDLILVTAITLSTLVIFVGFGFFYYKRGKKLMTMRESGL